MRARGVAVIVAFVLAAGATLGVFLYVRGVKNENKTSSQSMTTVVVSKQDINTGTNLNPLIQNGDFTTLQVPNDAIVQGAVTDLTQLQNRTTATFILANEQISTARLQGSTTRSPIGIPAGDEAVTVQLEAQRVLNGVIQAGDHVVVYATSTATSGSASISGASQGGQKNQGFFPGATLTLVPDAQVLKTLNPSSSNGTGSTFVTLALNPHDAAAVIAAQAQGYLWFSLLPPNQKGRPQPPVFVGSGK